MEQVEQVSGMTFTPKLWNTHQNERRTPISVGVSDEVRRNQTTNLRLSVDHARGPVLFAMRFFSTVYMLQQASVDKCETCDRSFVARVKLKISVIAKPGSLSLSETFPCTHKDEVAASLSPAELGAGKVTSYPAHKTADIAAEARKRSACTPVKQTLNARFRAGARTEEWSDIQSPTVSTVFLGEAVW